MGFLVTVTSVPASATSVMIKAANADRTGLLVYNDADKALYLNFGQTASLTMFTVKVLAGGYYEVPTPVYSGIVAGIWDAAPAGAVRVTELT